MDRKEVGKDLEWIREFEGAHWDRTGMGRRKKWQRMAAAETDSLGRMAKGKEKGAVQGQSEDQVGSI